MIVALPLINVVGDDVNPVVVAVTFPVGMGPPSDAVTVTAMESDWTVVMVGVEGVAVSVTDPTETKPPPDAAKKFESPLYRAVRMLNPVASEPGGTATVAAPPCSAVVGD